MARDKDGPNRLQNSELFMLSEAPKVGMLVLQSDDGEIEIAINEVVALELWDLLDQFLSDPSERGEPH